MIALHTLVSPLYLLMLVIYVIFIQHERGGLWKTCKLIGVPGYVLDVLLNYTHVSLVWGLPRHGQHTISQRVNGMKFGTDQPAKDAKLVSMILDRLAPSGKH